MTDAEVAAPSHRVSAGATSHVDDIGTQRFTVTLEDNPTARAFVQLLPVTLDMAELNGNEKHATLPRSLPTNAERPGTIRTGDVLLYGNNTLVVFYETFRSATATRESAASKRAQGWPRLVLGTAFIHGA